MFNYFGLTEQLFQTVYVLNTSMHMEKIICGISYKFIRIPENRMYGLETIKVKDTYINISSKEKTLIDLLYFNKPVGGIDSAVATFTQVAKNKKCDIKKLIEYASYFPGITIFKRVGIILEKLGCSDAELRPLIKSIKETAVSSLNGSRKGKLNKKWRVIVNDSQR